MVDPIPESVVQRRNGLVLRSAQGEFSLPAARLRVACRCADCIAATLRGTPPQPTGGLYLTDVIPVGNYALQLRFSDGHDRGIYPWSLLYDLHEGQPA
jgi:DUF971 family protein